MIRNLCKCSTCSFLLQFSSCSLQSEDASIINSVLPGYKVIEDSFEKAASSFLRKIFRYLLDCVILSENQDWFSPCFDGHLGDNIPVKYSPSERDWDKLLWELFLLFMLSIEWPEVWCIHSARVVRAFKTCKLLFSRAGCPPERHCTVNLQAG